MKKHNVKTGDRFGRLCVIGFGKNSGRVVVVCDCGNRLDLRVSQVLRKMWQSCGCLKRDIAIHRNKNELRTQNGLSGTPTGNTWWSMIKRCYDKNNAAYATYGAVGIVVCEYLRVSMSNLVELIGKRPEGTSIDRINGLRNYSCGKCAECLEKEWPMNVRWATRIQQARNRKTNRMATINGVTKCATQWAEESRLKPATVIARLASGWVGERLLIAPRRFIK